MELQGIKQRLGIIGSSPGLDRALEVAVRVAPTDLSVLITGESGVGKEFFPQIIHAYSARKHGNYIAVNCGAIPEGTIDSELFGHEKGAFTGATDSRKGYFEEANGGTIFLDEVAELPLTTQVRLLRVLQSGEFIRVGSSKAQKTNVRVVAATNIDLHRADITRLLQELSKSRYLISSGVGRGTRYTVNEDYLNGTTDIIAKDKSKGVSKDESKAVSKDESRHGNVPIRLSRYELQRQILNVCAEYQSVESIADLVHKTAHYLISRVIPAMIKGGMLEREFPDNPKHPQQRYRAKK